ncbi:MAG: prepilin-type N-terminal cleavage/methylation domain-containing protein [Pseudomonadota bacterium]
MQARNRGFTLIEMIGVVAVIGILASVAAPMIFDAIRNARVTAFVEEANSLRTAVTNYYNDTGAFPNHRPLSTAVTQKVLMTNPSTAPIPGWNGPYIEKEIANPFNPSGQRGLWNETNANYQFDLDGDGNVDTTRVSVLRMDNVSDEDARRISDILDGDGDVTTGNGAWFAAGRVKRFGVNSDNPSILLVYMARE